MCSGDGGGRGGGDATFTGAGRDVLLHHLRHLVVEDDEVEGPALVLARHLLPHRREEALRVEEAGHPEADGTALEHPRVVLLLALEQVGEPEAERRGLPRHLAADGGQRRVRNTEGREGHGEA